MKRDLDLGRSDEVRWRLSKLNLSYGLGELVIVVAGVLIALAVGEWNDNRRARVEEVRILERLTSDLREDVQALDSQLSALESKEASLLRIRSVLTRSGRPDDPAGFLRDVIEGANYGWNQSVGQRVTFDELLGSGKLSLIRDPDLRNRIARYFAARRGYGQRIDERETPFPHLSYRLVPRQNEGSVEGDERRADLLESDLSADEVDRRVVHVLDSEIGDYVDAEINLSRFIRNVSLRARQHALELIEGLDTYHASIR